jgi:acetoin utilization protein AcuC
MCAVAFLYHELYNGRGFSPISDSWRRYPMAVELIKQLGLYERLLVVSPSLAGEVELELVHSPEFVREVRERVASGTGRFDRSTPIYPGLYQRALAAVGATLEGARLIARGEVSHAFNPSGGLHHAARERASGFCLFNDIVIAVRALQREHGLSRIAVLDVDGHHGDGTQAELYDEPILYISLHRYDGRFYPATGSLNEMGSGLGLGYTVNIPLPRRCGDRPYLLALNTLVAPLLRDYRPEYIILQFGTDGHFQDPLVRLALTTSAYAETARLVHDLAHTLCGGRLLVTGGGGYNPEATSRCWALLLATLAGDRPTPDHAVFGPLFDTGPAPEDPTAEDQVGPVVDTLARRLLGCGQRGVQ